MELTKVVNRNKDILEVEGKCLGQKIRFILVYFDVKQYKSGGERNEKIKKEVERIMEKEEGEAKIILGDFNGHIGLLGTQPLDKNGKTILSWLESYNLTLLNLDENCEGVCTPGPKEAKKVQWTS